MDDRAPTFRLRRLLWLLLPVGYIAGLVAVWVALVPQMYETSPAVFLLILLDLISWFLLASFCIAYWGGWSPVRLGFSVLCVPGTALFLLMLQSFVTHLCVEHWPVPPRPMFHNLFVYDERALLPRWRRPHALTDEFGHWSWVDSDDNVLLVVITGVRSRSRGNALNGGLDNATIHVGADENDQYVKLPRTKNALVVVRPDGVIRQFALAPEVARRFFEARQFQSVENILRESADLVSLAERAAWDQFLVGYTEPASATRGDRPTEE